MNQVGRYEVVGRREYRGHKPGTTFEARIDPGPERRAVVRGDIRLLERIIPSLQPGSVTLPDGWLTPKHEGGS